MTLPIVTVRPEPGCSATAEAARETGLMIACFPLSRIEPVAWTMPEGPFDGLLVGSANAFRHGGTLVDRLVDKPVYAVGESTATAARTQGFAVAVIGQGGLQDLLGNLPQAPLRLLRIAGAEHVSLSPPPQVTIFTVIAYRAEPLPVPEKLASVLRDGAVVLLHSAAAARHLANECDRQGIDRSKIRLAALGPRIAMAAGLGWADVCAASEPNDPALLALAREMCH